MNISIGERIKNRRKELNITQIQIQNATGISSGNMSGIESGKSLPSASALIELSKILNCSIDWILTGISPISKNFSFLILNGTFSMVSENYQKRIRTNLLKY